MPLVLLAILTACSRQLGYPEAPRSGQDISVDISALQPGIPQYFSYSLKEMKIHFFVVKMDDRVISFLDACTKCYPQKKGFSFDNGSVICRACDERYPISEIEKGFGSCYPIKIEGRTKDGRYLISAAELERTGTKFFR
ncbi:MAG: DUF2318 domain-containing protein [Nitrospirae bacterium]|nr:DUF2318 domain-containing protein [Nitrospirota bacterium]